VVTDLFFFHWIFVIVLAGVINILNVVESQKYVKLIEIVRIGKSVFDDSMCVCVFETTCGLNQRAESTFFERNCDFEPKCCF